VIEPLNVDDLGAMGRTQDREVYLLARAVKNHRHLLSLDGFDDVQFGKFTRHDVLSSFSIGLALRRAAAVNKPLP
jgi:hypothetical protein